MVAQRESTHPSERLIRSHMFRSVTSMFCLTCYKLVKQVVIIQRRHRTIMILRDIIWKTTRRKTANINNRTRVLKSPRCHNRKMIIAARENLSYDIIINQMSTEDESEENNEGMMAALYVESIFHKEGRVEDDGWPNEDLYVDMGDDIAAEVEQKPVELSEKPPTMAFQRTGQLR